MIIPKEWRSHGAPIAWIVFAILMGPFLVFAVWAGFPGGFEFSKIISMLIMFTVIGFVSWLLRYGLSKGSLVLVATALLFVILILVAYASVITLLIGGLKIRVF